MESIGLPFRGAQIRARGHVSKPKDVRARGYVEFIILVAYRTPDESFPTIISDTRIEA